MAKEGLAVVVPFIENIGLFLHINIEGGVVKEARRTCHDRF